jgi:hypothetical protein
MSMMKRAKTKRASVLFYRFWLFALTVLLAAGCLLLGRQWHQAVVEQLKERACPRSPTRGKRPGRQQGARGGKRTFGGHKRLREDHPFGGDHGHDRTRCGCRGDNPNGLQGLPMLLSKLLHRSQILTAHRTQFLQR